MLTRALSLQALVLPRTSWLTVATGARPATRLKGAALALVRGGDRLLLHNLLLDLVSSLTFFFALSGSSNGTLLLLQLQLRPRRVTPWGYPVDPTPPGPLAGSRAILTAMPAGSGRNATRLGTNWRLSPNRPGLLSSSGSISASSCSRSSMVSPATCPIST
jgi:hypothetical protein